MIDKRKFYINGDWVDPVNKNDCNVIDPSTEEPYVTISLGSADAVSYTHLTLPTIYSV